MSDRPEARLAELRAAIGSLDVEISALLERRLALAGEAAGAKARGGAPLRDLRREAEALAPLRGSSPGRRAALEAVFRAIGTASLQQQTLDRARARARISPVEIAPGVRIGGGDLALIAGPCSVESRASLRATARAVREAGAAVLRGGCFKPRTSPYDFQGLGRDGVEILRECAREIGLPAVTEVLDPRDVGFAAERIEILQIGSRSMQNTPLLREAAQAGRPVLLKRGMGATLEEVAKAAEHLRTAGNGRILLCERGIRTFGDATRFTLDISSVPILRAWTGLPVLVDPSHAAGYREWVEPLALAAVAAGADGLLIETHHDPDASWSDARQAVGPETLSGIARRARRIHDALKAESAEGRLP